MGLQEKISFFDSLSKSRLKLHLTEKEHHVFQILMEVTNRDQSQLMEMNNLTIRLSKDEH
jgi:hypothetical protein